MLDYPADQSDTSCTHQGRGIDRMTTGKSTFRIGLRKTSADTPSIDGTNRRSVSTRLASATAVFLILCTVSAQSGWIDDHLAARDACGPNFPGLNDLVTRGGPGVLFGRRMEDWTQADLDALPAAFKRCQRTATERGAQIYPSEATDGIVAAVHRAWSERDRRNVHDEAVAKEAEAAARRAGALASEERDRTLERKRVAAFERRAALEQANQAIARAEAEAAEATAKREIDEARGRAARAEVEARQVVAAAEIARRTADEQSVGVAEPPPGSAPGAQTGEGARGPEPERRSVQRGGGDGRDAERPTIGKGDPTPPRLRIGQDARVIVGFMACPTVGDLTQVKSFALASGDALAAAKYGHAHGCEGLEEGTLGRAEDFSVLANATCLRPQGEPTCLWLPTPFLAPIR